MTLPNPPKKVKTYLDPQNRWFLEVPPPHPHKKNKKTFVRKSRYKKHAHTKDIQSTSNYKHALFFSGQVEIHYTASCEGRLLDTSIHGSPIGFTLGSGNVMEAWDRIVATMRKAGGSEICACLVSRGACTTGRY